MGLLLRLPLLQVTAQACLLPSKALASISSRRQVGPHPETSTTDPVLRVVPVRPVLLRLVLLREQEPLQVETSSALSLRPSSNDFGQ